MDSIQYPYHLCLVCGMQSNTTSRVCSKHVGVTYDAQGNALSYTDYLDDWGRVYTWGYALLVYLNTVPGESSFAQSRLA